jgi:hypothetical protein
MISFLYGMLKSSAIFAGTGIAHFPSARISFVSPVQPFPPSP